MHFSIAFVIVALPFLVNASPLVGAPLVGTAIPIVKHSNLRRADGSVNTTALQAQINRSVFKIEKGFSAYKKNTGLNHPLASAIQTKVKRAGRGVPLTNDRSQVWYGSISVGVPAQTYTVEFDTGSSDLILPGPSCNTDCGAHAKYAPGSSSTSVNLGKTFTWDTGNGSSISGQQYTDTVSVAGLNATSQALGAATAYPPSEESPADGVLGMAFQAISDLNASPVFQTLISQSQMTMPVFSFKLAHDNSELFLGGINSQLVKGPLTYVEVTAEGYWQCQLDSLTVDNTEVVTPIEVIIDTGSTPIIGDPDNVAAVYSSIAGAQSAPQYGEGVYTIPCDFNSTIALKFGRYFNIDPRTFNLGPVAPGSSTCIGGIASNSALTNQFWVLGDVFLQNVYTVFDSSYPKIGFAHLA